MAGRTTGASALSLLLATSPAVANTWEFLGPTSVPVLSLAGDVADPGRLYAVTGAGVHHTADGGLTWERRLEGTESHVVVADPNTSASAYVEAGCFDLDSTCGVYVTRDGGNTWTVRGRAAFPAPGTGILVALPTQPTTLYASTRDEVGAGLAVSEDAGETWAERLPARTSFFFTALAADPFEESTLLAGVDDIEYRGVARSSDAGRSWGPATGLPPQLVIALAYDHRASGVVYVSLRTDVGGLGGLHRSDDGGRTWRTVDGAPAATTTVRDVVVDPADSRRLYLATDSGVAFSDAAGACARPLGSGLPPGVVGDLELDRTGAGYLYAATSAGVFRTRPPARPVAPSSAARVCRSSVGRAARHLARHAASIACAPRRPEAAGARRRALEQRDRGRTLRACRGVTPTDVGFPESSSLADWVDAVVDAYVASFEDRLGPCPDHGPVDIVARAATVHDLDRAHRALSWCLGADGPLRDPSPAARSGACAARLAGSTAAIPAAAAAIRALVWDACERLAALGVSLQ